MKKFTLEITVFLSGAVVMMLELVGSRILAPFVGTSTFIWTSLIGVILASLSLGYYHGGKKADEDPSLKRLSNILLLAGISIGIVALLNQTLLSFLTGWIHSVKWTAAAAACLLFGFPAYLLGMVSPQAVKIRMTSLETSGATIGRLYALSSVGSIVGTFLVGFYLMAWMGSRNILFLLCLLTLLLSLLNRRSRDTVFALFLFGVSPWVQSRGSAPRLMVEDTGYNSVQVLTQPYPRPDSPVCRIMKVGNEYSSGMYLDSDSLAFVYSRFYKLMFAFHPRPVHTLLIGGGAYSVPKYFQKACPGMKMDVLEIDPDLTRIAMEKFRFRPDSLVVPVHEDGRIFLNRNARKYDVIMGDAYRSLFSIPFHLVSDEAIARMEASLTEEGLLMMNILSPAAGENRDLLFSVLKTCRRHFPEVRVFRPNTATPAGRVQNLMVVCLKGGCKPPPENLSPQLREMMAHELDISAIPYDEQGLVLTDDFAPVEHYAEKMLSSYFQ